jgi:hypothetical protein
MAVSFGHDYIGHVRPSSREAHENMLRLDETLGWFIDSSKLRDSATIVIAMTGDTASPTGLRPANAARQPAIRVCASAGTR